MAIRHVVQAKGINQRLLPSCARHSNVSSDMVDKTNAMRVLDASGVEYEVYTYDPDQEVAGAIADQIGLPSERVYKTLVVVRERGRPLLVMVPVDGRLDTKGVARAVGEKKVRMASHKEAERLTGLQVGGISALSLIGRPFDVYLDHSALQHDQIAVSAGRPGVNLGVAPADLLAATGAEVVDAAVGA